MSRLWLKLFRDLRSYRAQAIGIAVTTMLGISLYHSFYLSYRSLSASYEWGYRELRFADFTIQLDQAPRQLIQRMGAIPGVRMVEGRITRDIRVEQTPGRREVVTGRIISVPDEGQGEINRLVVIEGSFLGTPDQREVLLEREFAEVHEYTPGDIIYPVVNGVRSSFRVAGIVSSVEYLYAVRSKEELFPAPHSFGVMWMRQQQAERLFQMHGAINEVVCLTYEGERERVMGAFHADLRRYGATPPVPAEEQPSRRLLDLDLEGFAQFAIIFPALFIGAAALTVYSTLARTIDRERQQIGFLRASGLPAWRVGVQYLSLAGLMGVVGAIPGVLLGQWFALVIASVYLEILGIPYLRMASGFFVGLLGISISLTASLVAGWRPALSAAKMKPADAMRPGTGDTAQLKPPRLLTRLQEGTTYLTRIAVNNLFRHPHRTAYTIFGVAAGIILMILTMSLMDAMDHSMNYYFAEVRNYDVDVGFAGPVSDGIVEQVRAWPTVEWAEGTIGLPVTLHYGGETHDYVVSGVPAGSRLQVFRDEQERRVTIEGPGLYPDTAIAERIGVERGSVIRMEYAYNSRDVQVAHPVRVTQTIRQPVGAGIYMSADALHRHFGARLGFPSGTIGGMVIKARPGYERAVVARAYDLPGAVVVEATHDMRRMIEEQMVMSYTFIGILMLFAGALTVAIVYNTVSTNVRERRSEIATLRALGLRMNEITRFITLENLISTVMGIAVGVPLGVLGSRWLMSLWEMEAMSLDFYIAPRTYIIAIGFTLLLVLICQIPPFRRIEAMNLARMTRIHGE